jgi:hypothetical protein
MRNLYQPSITLTIRLSPRVAAALNAARPWQWTGHKSRNAWLAALVEGEIDMRSVPKEVRYDRSRSQMKTYAGRI